ncbi:MAG: DKNYY domain-containing protein [Alistipes sp.]|jgi:hypothetical protein|nr:DKNYY domain-containing protein [Alistipes sp.]
MKTFKASRLVLTLGLVFGLFAAVPLAFMAIRGTGEGYVIGVDGITHNGAPLDIDRDSFEWLGASIVKDSTRVYFHGQPVAWADAPTFEQIGPTFFRDRNGLYRETTSIFTENQLVPLTGDFDSETLTGVDHAFYKDKNRVYHFDFNFIAGGDPLEPVDVEGIDPATFEAVDEVPNVVWYRDAKWIYFGGWHDFRRAEEIDRDTFEVLSRQVAKDKNNVYHLTRGLRSEGERATERDDYAVLKGAHAPSFRMIDQQTFEDRNTAWTIE